MKGSPFLSKMVYKRVRVWVWGGASPYKTFLSTPPPPGGLVVNQGPIREREFIAKITQNTRTRVFVLHFLWIITA